MAETMDSQLEVRIGDYLVVKPKCERRYFLGKVIEILFNGTYGRDYMKLYLGNGEYVITDAEALEFAMLMSGTGH